MFIEIFRTNLFTYNKRSVRLSVICKICNRYAEREYSKQVNTMEPFSRALVVRGFAPSRTNNVSNNCSKQQLSIRHELTRWLISRSAGSFSLLGWVPDMKLAVKIK